MKARHLTWIVLVTAMLAPGCRQPTQSEKIRVTTWNLQWFPDGSPREATPQRRTENISRAAGTIRELNPDILLLQEVKNWGVCTRLADAIGHHTYRVAVCSKFPGNQQVAILAKQDAWAAWSEPWEAMDGVDPPRGLAFAWFHIGKAHIGVYSVHLKSNLVLRGDKEAEMARNIRKREVAARQVLHHIGTVVQPQMPDIRSIVVGGDFNTNLEQREFAAEKTLHRLMDDGFVNAFGSMPLSARVTHPGDGRFPDATFDYLFVKNAKVGQPTITPTNQSDHYPVTVDVAIH